MYIKTLFQPEGSKAINYSKVKEADQEAENMATKGDTKVDEVMADVAKKHGLTRQEELNLLQHRVKETKNVQDLKERINTFSDDDPQILKLILDIAPQFLSNPRDLKRFMNVFRFQYFLLLARESTGFSIIPDKCLMRWIILSLQWPDVIQWFAME